MRSAVIPILSLLILSISGICQEVAVSTEDTYIRGGEYSHQNFGNTDRIEIKTAPAGFPQFTRKGYLKFDLSGWEKEWIGKAILLLQAEEAASIYLTASLATDQWDEETLTWMNAPVPLGKIDSAQMNQEEKMYQIDITSAFFLEAFGDEILSLVLEDKAAQDKLVKLMSTESGSDPPTVITIPSTDTIIDTPELLYTHLQGLERIELKWLDHSSNETGFVVERKMNDASFVAIDTLLCNTTTYLDTVSVGNDYLYRIKAVNPIRNSAYSETRGIDLSAQTVPDPVTVFSGNAAGTGSVTLDWTYPGNAIGFIVFREEESGFMFLDSLEANDSIYKDYNCSPLTAYRYYITAFNYLGNSISSDTVEVITMDRKSYYFDASSGDDSHPFNSKSTPWRTLDRLNEITFGPGDSVLLKSGETWAGQIAVKGSGSAGHPITLSSYGPGRKPMIDGNGSSGAVITLQDVSNWNVSNLELTNPSTFQGERIGVLIKSSGGNHGHFHINDLYIHDIFGNYSFQMSGKNTGGIGIIGEKESRFDDILIENCEINDIVRVGIFTNGNPGTRGDRPITNLVIRNNIVNRCAGDGMIIRYAHRPLIEHNLAMENHNGPEELVEFGVAIWVRSTDEAILQYNRVFDTKGSKDGQAFDADLDAYRTLVQYNYTRNNEGGFMLVYGSSVDAIVRYNISQDDGRLGKHILDFPVWTSPRGSGIIHNNVFYIGAGNEAVLVDEALETAKLYNNIVINEGGGPLTVYSESQTAKFSNNCLVGYSDQETSVNVNPVVGDPLLVDAGNGGYEISTLEGYWITPGSPCIRAGVAVSLMEGNYWSVPALFDFWGNSLNQETPDAGVHQFSGPLGMKNQLSGHSGKILWQVAPVPFSQGFYVSMNLPESRLVRINMCDMGGRFIEVVYEGELMKGDHTLYCAMDRYPEARSMNGIYLLQLTFPGSSFRDSRMIVRD